MTRPLLSIAIPTRNRPIYLLSVLDEFLRCTRSDFEVIVQDNSDDDVLRSEIARRGDSRVRYTYTAARLSVVQNCDLAIQACAGHFVCMLGDDDGLLLEESLELVAQCVAKRVEAVVPSSFYYTWPGLRHKIWGNMSGRLAGAKFTGRCERVDVAGELSLALARGGAFGLFHMPRVYHGFVSKEVLSRLYDLAGTCFPGPSPDMANAVALSRIIHKCYLVSFPFIIVGHSKGSGGGMGSEKKHWGDISAQAHLPLDTAARWNRAIPFFWSGPTIYAQSAHCAIGALCRQDAPHINFACLYAACLIYERHSWGAVILAVRHSGEWLPWLAVRVLGYSMVISARRARSFVGNLIKHLRRSSQTDAAADMAEATAAARRRVSRQVLPPPATLVKFT
jgi:glycosyltransferase involved in cell wall biosynthesis